MVHHSKYKENSWLNDLLDNHFYFNYNRFNPSFFKFQNNKNKTLTYFPPKKCNICGKKYDGSGMNQWFLPKFFDRLPMKLAPCRDCKKKENK